MPRIVPDIVCDQVITAVSAHTTVQEAARKMAERVIAAVVITEGDTLRGIMTERDVTTRVVAKGLDPATVTVGEVMTPDPDTLVASQHPAEALRMMRDRNYRHLPVVDDAGTVCAMVSVRDLYAFVQAEMESDIVLRDRYISGEAYGATA